MDPNRALGFCLADVLALRSCTICRRHKGVLKRKRSPVHRASQSTRDALFLFLFIAHFVARQMETMTSLAEDGRPIENECQTCLCGTQNGQPSIWPDQTTTGYQMIDIHGRDMATIEKACGNDGHLSDQLPVPDEILSAVLALLKPRDRWRAAGVQRRWYACSGRPDLLEYAKSHACSAGVWWCAVLTGRLDVLKWAFGRGVALGQRSLACEMAARAGHLKVIRWLRRRGFAMGPGTCARAAKGGHLKVLKWALRKGCQWDSSTCTEAASGGHFDILQWARRKGCPWDKWTCIAAAGAGRLDILQWARAEGCPWSKKVCVAAAQGGHLKVLKWARANGCGWHRDVSTPAARGGHLKLLKWARANGCPWNEWICIHAAECGHLKVLKWARRKGMPWDERVCARAAAEGHLDVLQWATRKGCPWGSVVKRAAKYGQIEVLDWAMANGGVWDDDIWRAIQYDGCRRGRVRRWAAANGICVPDKE